MEGSCPRTFGNRLQRRGGTDGLCRLPVSPNEFGKYFNQAPLRRRQETVFSKERCDPGTTLPGQAWSEHRLGQRRSFIMEHTS